MEGEREEEEEEQQEEGRGVEDQMKGKWEVRINTRLEKDGMEWRERGVRERVTASSALLWI